MSFLEFEQSPYREPNSVAHYAKTVINQEPREALKPYRHDVMTSLIVPYAEAHEPDSFLDPIQCATHRSKLYLGEGLSVDEAKGKGFRRYGLRADIGFRCGSIDRLVCTLLTEVGIVSLGLPCRHLISDTAPQCREAQPRLGRVEEFADPVCMVLSLDPVTSHIVETQYLFSVDAFASAFHALSRIDDETQIWCERSAFASPKHFTIPSVLVHLVSNEIERNLNEVPMGMESLFGDSSDPATVIGYRKLEHNPGTGGLWVEACIARAAWDSPLSFDLRNSTCIQSSTVEFSRDLDGSVRAVQTKIVDEKSIALSTKELSAAQHLYLLRRPLTSLFKKHHIPVPISDEERFDLEDLMGESEG